MRPALVLPVALVLCACSPSEPESLPEAPPAAAEQRLGVWVLAEGSQRTLEDPARITALIEDARRMGATDLFVQVYRAGKSWFPSTQADPTPYQEILERHGSAPLSLLLEQAHTARLRVHAWFNALSLAGNRAAPLLRALGREAVLIDREGRSLLDYPELEVPVPERFHTRMGTPGVWLDPAIPGVIEYLERTVDDLVRSSPELDGLHLDFIRHPMALPLTPGSRFDVGLDFGYSQASKLRYERESGRRFARGDDWDHYRREQVSEVVRRLHARLPAHWQQSAAVIAYADRAYLTAMQDWRGWLDEGVLDFAVAMAYTRDDRMLRYLSHQLAGGVGGDRVWVGVGSWLFVRDPQRARAQLEIAREARPAGVVLFSYDALVGERPALEALAWAP